MLSQEICLHQAVKETLKKVFSVGILASSHTFARLMLTTLPEIQDYILLFEEKVEIEEKIYIAGIRGLPGSRGGYQWILVYGYCHTTDNKHIGIPARWARSGLN